SGDRQHLWTPVAIVRILRDMFVLEDGKGINLAVGTAREWLASGKMVGISHASTHFGEISYHLQYDSKTKKVSGEVSFPDDISAEWAILNIRLPGGLKVKSVNSKVKVIALPDGSGFRWVKPQGILKFDANIGK
ncbi:MAG: hypothetical protein Q8862_02500, partial [Bacteroidota bacterium]|nr:hypothetical protein [Bacteroidota bacterium]